MCDQPILLIIIILLMYSPWPIKIRLHRYIVYCRPTFVVWDDFWTPLWRWGTIVEPPFLAPILDDINSSSDAQGFAQYSHRKRKWKPVSYSPNSKIGFLKSPHVSDDALLVSSKMALTGNYVCKTSRLPWKGLATQHMSAPNHESPRHQKMVIRYSKHPHLAYLCRSESIWCYPNRAIAPPLHCWIVQHCQYQ